MSIMSISPNTTIALFPIKKVSLVSMMVMIEQFNYRLEAPVWIDIVFEAVIHERKSQVAICHVEFESSQQWFDNLNRIHLEGEGKPMYGNDEIIEISSLNADHVRILLITEHDNNTAEHTVAGFHCLKGRWDDNTAKHFLSLVKGLHPELDELLQD